MKVMQIKSLYTLCILCLSVLMSCAQAEKGLNGNVEVNTIEDSHYFLRNHMSDSLYQSIDGRQVKKSNRAIKTKKEVIELGESVFFKEFGENYNSEERRYMVNLIKGFWIVKGMLPVGHSGGTLVTVIDSESGELFYTQVWK